MRTLKSKKGSLVKLSSGIDYIIDFDWLEEGCCCDCGPEYNFDNGITVSCCKCKDKTIDLSWRLNDIV